MMEAKIDVNAKQSVIKVKGRPQVYGCNVLRTWPPCIGDPSPIDGCDNAVLVLRMATYLSDSDPSLLAFG